MRVGSWWLCVGVCKGRNRRAGGLLCSGVFLMQRSALTFRDVLCGVMVLSFGMVVVLEYVPGHMED
jgi:hypothetical protein